MLTGTASAHFQKTSVFLEMQTLLKKILRQNIAACSLFFLLLLVVRESLINNLRLRLEAFMRKNVFTLVIFLLVAFVFVVPLFSNPNPLPHENAVYKAVSYNDLANYLKTTASASEINYIEITDLQTEHLRSEPSVFGVPPTYSPLARILTANATKKVFLKFTFRSGEILTSLNSTFGNCASLIGILELPPSVNDMTYCFLDCVNLTTPPPIPSGVISLEGCFIKCASLTTAPAIPSKVIYMRACFSDCTNLVTVPNIPNSVRNMESCFYNCKNLITAPDIPSSVLNMNYCFVNCSKLQSVTLNCTYNALAFTDTFKGCPSLLSGGIKVPKDQLASYSANTSAMGIESRFAGQ